MYQELQKRIRQIMEVEGISPSRFADKIEVNRSRLSHIFSGRNNPSLEIIYSILKAYPEINPAWVLSGAQPMKLSGPAPVQPPGPIAVDGGKPPVASDISHEEAPAEYGARKQPGGVGRMEAGNAGGQPIKTSPMRQKRIKQIVLLYDDGTYEVVSPG